MVGRRRNFQAEYRRRIAKASAKGLSKSQARGHRKPGEKQAKKTAQERAVEDHKLQHALRVLRQKKNIAKAAKEAGYAPEKLRQIAIEKGVLEKRGRRLVVKSDIARRVLVYNNGQRKVITLGTLRDASLVGRHMSAVGQFLIMNDAALLKPFKNKFVTDDAGIKHPLETRPNVLFRLSFSGGQSFEQIYRIVV